MLADKVYSGRDQLRLSDLTTLRSPAADEVLLPRQALHAHRLRFQHPVTQAWMEFVAPCRGVRADAGGAAAIGKNRRGGTRMGRG